MKNIIIKILLISILFVIIGIILKFTFGGLFFLFIIGLISGLIFSKKKQSKLKYILICGWIGFLIPWIVLTIISITCTSSHCNELGFLAWGAIIYSIIFFLIGAIIGYIIFKRKHGK